MRDKLKGLPGVQVVMAQPISDRVDEMVTGVRSDIAVKVFGDDLDQLKKIAGQIGKVAQALQGAQDLRIERISGQQYLSIEIDRQAIARLGLNVADVNDVLETAIGGKVATEIFEGERRFPGVVRLPEHFRNNVEAISNVLITSPRGAQVRLDRCRQHPGHGRPGPDLARTRQAPDRRRRQRQGPRPRQASSPNCSRRSMPRSSCRKAITWSGAASSRTWSGRSAT
jgi:multidrug efflux pump subunit AcrB